jgi:DUF1680 family protein
MSEPTTNIEEHHMETYIVEFYEETHDKKYGKVAGKLRTVEVVCDSPEFADVEAMKAGAKIHHLRKPAYLKPKKEARI